MKGTVLLVHGLLRFSGSMKTIGRACEDDGFRTEYVSHKDILVGSSDGLAKLKKAIAVHYEADGFVNLVGHSMGAKLIMHALADLKNEGLLVRGRAVTIAGSIGESQFARAVSESPLGFVIGKSSGFLMAATEDPKLPLVEFGNIVAIKEDPVINAILALTGLKVFPKGEVNDGKVTQSGAEYSWAKATLHVKYMHDQALTKYIVGLDTAYFLTHGHFLPG